MKLRTHLFQISLFSSLLTLTVLFSPPFGQAQDDPFHCSLLPDSEAVQIPAGIAALVHPFGSDVASYPNEFDPDSTLLSKAFSQVFRIYLTESVSDRWSQSEWEEIITTIMNNDTTTTNDDVFGRVWGYFLRDDKDSNPYYAGVRFVAGYDTFVTIDLYLYDASDIPCPCTGDSYDVACRSYSKYLGRNELLINANDVVCPSEQGCATCGSISLDDMVNRGIAHELQHLCFNANAQNGYPGVNETLSTLAEYFMDAWGPTAFDIPYDASFMDYETDHCDLPRYFESGDPPKYSVYKPWVIHLYEVFKGNVADSNDDLLYRWIRNNDPNRAQRLSLKQLSILLWDDDFAWIGGADAWSRLGRVYGDFLVSKFCNAPDFGSHGEFGNGPINTVERLGYFRDNYDTEGIGIPELPVDCPPYDSLHWGSWNVRVLAPSYVLTGEHENSMTSVSGIYQNGDDTPELAEWDTSKDYIDVYVWGTDYVMFRAGQYFRDGGEHELTIRVSGTDKEPPTGGAIRPIGRIMGYADDQGMLQLHPEDLLFVEPLTFEPATTSGATVSARTITVTDFGRSVKAVVLAIGAESMYPGFDFPYNAFVYEYEYGVFTPGASSRTWDGDIYACGDVTVATGGTLNVAPGTRIKIWPADIAHSGTDSNKIEIDVEGSVVANGTQGAPIVFERWTPTETADWGGLYFDSQSSGGTFNYCTLGHADIVIDSRAPVTLNHCEVHDAADALIRVTDSTLNINLSEISSSNGDGIVLEGSDATIDSTEIHDCYGYGLRQGGTGALSLSHCTVHDNDAGLYCGSGTVELDNCTIASNAGDGPNSGAINIAADGTAPVTIDDSVIAFNDGPVVNKSDGQMPANIALARCVVFGNTAGSYRTDAQWAASGAYVYAEDPAFCSPSAGQYTLYAFSPAAPGANGEAGLHFQNLVGAHEVDCVPTATITVAPGNETWVPGDGIVGCPQGDIKCDHFTVQVAFNSAEVTRSISASELSLQPPYLAKGLVSDSKIRGNSSTGSTVTLDHPYVAGYGTNDQVSLYLDGYELAEKATLIHRSPDMKNQCSGDASCPDGQVNNSDFSWWATHYPTEANPVPYFEAADYVSSDPPVIGLSDYSFFVYHFGHQHPGTGTLLQTAGVEETVPTHAVLRFTEEFLTSAEHRLYVDVTLDDCAGLKWCLFAIKTNRPDLTYSAWEPTDWAEISAPLAPVGAGPEQQLVFGVIMINDTDEVSRYLGRLVFDVQGRDSVTISDHEFVLTIGEVELATDQGGPALSVGEVPVFAKMNGATGRVLEPKVERVFHNRLEQNFPNPFNPQTALAYSLKRAGHVTLTVYDVGGRRVRELVNEHRMPGAYKVMWDGTDGKGIKVASGVYFYKLVAGSFTDTKKMIMLK